MSKEPKLCALGVLGGKENFEAIALGRWGEWLFRGDPQVGPRKLSNIGGHGPFPAGGSASRPYGLRFLSGLAWNYLFSVMAKTSLPGSQGEAYPRYLSPSKDLLD